MLARAASALQVRPGEGRLVTLLVLVMFLPSAGGAIGSPGVEALFYARFGVQYLPFMYVALGLVTLATSLLLTALLGRASRRWLYLTLPLVLSAVLILARLLVGLRLNWFYPVLWLGMYLLWTLQGSLTWGLAGTVCNTRQAKRLFPLIGAGGILGIAVGGLLTRWLVDRLGTENLLLVWAGALLLSYLFVGALLRDLRERRPRRPPRLLEAVARGYQFVRRSPLMRWIALSALLLSLLSFTVAFPFSQAVARQFPNEDALTGFLGVFQGLTTAVALLAALFVANRLYAWLGFMSALLALPLLYFGGFGLLLLLTSPFALLVAFRFVQMAWLQGISGAAYQAIFNVVPPGWREQTRTFVDGVPTQLGTVLVGLVLIAGQGRLQPWHLFAGGCLAAAGGALVIWRARQAYGLALAEALRAGQPHVFLSEPQPLGGFQRDATAMETVLAGMADPNPVVRRVAAEFLGSVRLPAAVRAAANALNDPDLQVRVAALRSLAEAQAAATMLDVTALLADPEPEARLQAVETLCQLAGHSHGLLLHLRPLLADPDPAVRSRVALAIIQTAAEPPAVAALMALVQSSAPAERVLGLRALAEWADPAAYDLAAIGVTDTNSSVRCAAVRAVARLSAQRSLALLVEALADESSMVRASAAQVLAGLGRPALSGLTRALTEPRLEAGALQALVQLPLRSPAAQLVDYGRAKVSLSLQYTAWGRAAAALAPATEPLRLLAESLAAAARLQALRAIEAIGLLDDTGGATLVQQGLQSRDPGQQANALEMIDNWDKRDLVRPVLTLWETAAETPAAATPAASAADVLSLVLHDADPWLRACAAFAAGRYSEANLQGQLDRLVASDTDAFVQATAAAALAAHPGAPLVPDQQLVVEGDAHVDTLATLSVMDRILFLRRVRLFSDLPPSELKQVAAITNEQYYLDGDIIAQQGEPGDEMYVIVSGEVRVTAEAGSQTVMELARRGPGEYVGEMAIISQEPRMASLIAHGDVRVLHIGQPQFEAILRERPETSLAVMRVLCARLREVQQRELAPA